MGKRRREITRQEEKTTMGSREIRMVAVADLVPSRMYLHRIVDDEEMRDLVMSIRENGVIAPILARPMNGKLVIVAGHRRWMAAKKAGLVEIPAEVRTLSDEEAQQIQIIENLQRKDVHPLDEADEFLNLLKVSKFSVAQAAAKVGKSVSYLVRRMKLADLDPMARKSFEGGKMGVDQALLLCRMSPEIQRRAMKEATASTFEDGKTLTAMLPAVSLRRWLALQCHVDLTKVPWDLKDEILLKEAGSCSACPKRSGSSPDLFVDVKGANVCTDAVCYGRKMMAWGVGAVSAAQSEGKEAVLATDEWSNPDLEKIGAVSMRQYDRVGKKEKCPDTVLAVFVFGTLRGSTARVCLAKRTKAACRVHGDASDLEQEKYWAKDRAARKKSKFDTRVNHRILDMMLSKMDAKNLGERSFHEGVAEGLALRTGSDALCFVCKNHGWAEEAKRTSGSSHYYEFAKTIVKKIHGMSLDELARLSLELVMAPQVFVRIGFTPSKEFRERAERMKIDVKSVEEIIRKDEDSERTSSKGKAKAPEKLKSKEE